MQHRSFFLAFLLLLLATGATAQPDALDAMRTALGVDGNILRRLVSLCTVAEGEGPAGAFTAEVTSERPFRVGFRQFSPSGEAHFRLNRLGPERWEGGEETVEGTP